MFLVYMGNFDIENGRVSPLRGSASGIPIAFLVGVIFGQHVPQLLRYVPLIYGFGSEGIVLAGGVVENSDAR